MLLISSVADGFPDSEQSLLKQDADARMFPDSVFVTGDD